MPEKLSASHCFIFCGTDTNRTCSSARQLLSVCEELQTVTHLSYVDLYSEMCFYFNIRLNAPIFRSDVLVYVPNHNKVAILLFSILFYFKL